MPIPFTDLLPDGAAAAFADVLAPTGASDTLARIRAAAKRQSDETAPAAEYDHPAPQAPMPELGAHEHPDFRGQLSTPAALRRYVLGGHGVVTLLSKRTGRRFTYKLTEPRNRAEGRLFISVLTGAENSSDYTWLGTLFSEPSRWRGRDYPPRWSHSNRSAISDQAPSAKAAAWLFERIVRGSDEDLDALLAQSEVWHEGRCGACGRKLTVPESVQSGIGPVCAAKAA